MKFIRTFKRKTYNINDYVGTKLLTRSRLTFIHLHEHRSRHNSKDMLNPLCSCSIEVETTTHYFLRCHLCNENPKILINDLENIDQSLPTLNDTNLASFARELL